MFARVVFFRVMRKNIPIPHQNRFHFKYATEQDFLREYNYCFAECDPTEISNLYFTANWMALLFATVDARGNKGLAMNVIPKVIEGFSARYSTGGGQSVQTAARVRIYEHEGSVKPHERPTRRSISIPVPHLSERKTGDSLYDDSIRVKRSPRSASSLEEERAYLFLTQLSESGENEYRRPQKRASIGPGTIQSIDYFGQ